jgi:hypothetical protein
MKPMAYALLFMTLLAGASVGCARTRVVDVSASPSMEVPETKIACDQSGGRWNIYTRNCDRW